MLRARWLAVFAIWASVVAEANAAPRVFVEADLDPPVVPVNLQSTLVVRLGYAVDVRSPRIEPPRPRLAEVISLGPEVVSEQVRDGLRYRVHEQAWAIVPFASGEIELVARASGTTPAALAELRGRQEFSLDAQVPVLRVTPAAADRDWLPAYNLQISAASAAPDGQAPYRSGDVLVRRITVRAIGVPGAAIPSLRWPDSPAFAIRLDPPQTGTNVEGRRIVGWRTETVRLQAILSGEVVLPAPVMAWWRHPGSVRNEASPAAERVVVLSSSQAANGLATPPSARPAPPGSATGRMTVAPLALLVVLVFAAWRWRRQIATANRRIALRRTLRHAARTGDFELARRSILALSRLPTLEQCRLRASSAGDQVLAGEIARLEAACYGPPRAGSWQSDFFGRSRTRL